MPVKGSLKFGVMPSRRCSVPSWRLNLTAWCCESCSPPLPAVPRWRPRFRFQPFGDLLLGAEQQDDELRQCSRVTPDAAES